MWKLQCCRHLCREHGRPVIHAKDGMDRMGTGVFDHGIH
jgi:hypothetical protein